MDVSTEDLSADFASFLELAGRGEPVVIVDDGRGPRVRTGADPTLLTFDLRRTQVARSTGLAVIGC